MNRGPGIEDIHSAVINTIKTKQIFDLKHWVRISGTLQFIFKIGQK